MCRLTVVQQLLNKVFKFGSISSTREDTRQEHTVLTIGCQNLVLLAALQFSLQDGCHTFRRPPSPAKTISTTVVLLVNENKVERLVLGNAAGVIVD